MVLSQLGQHPTPTDWVYRMPKFNAARRAELKVLGVESISAIPDDFRLSPRPEIIRDATRTGKPFVASDLSERLDGFGPPAFYLDFEAFFPAVPLYPRTRPYQTIPVRFIESIPKGISGTGNSLRRAIWTRGAGSPRR
jgi:hypothetical protein